MAGIEEELDRLARGIRRCRGCRLCETRTHAVPGNGDFRAATVLVGEAPGETEDRCGKPFQGRSGRFLDELLRGIGRTREEFFVTACVKCRPPKNRDPKPDELQACTARWLDRELDLLDPEVVVLLGRVAAVQLLGERGRLQDLHGALRRRNHRTYLLTYHPASGMRFPKARRAMQADFRKLAALL